MSIESGCRKGVGGVGVWTGGGRERACAEPKAAKMLATWGPASRGGGWWLGWPGPAALRAAAGRADPSPGALVLHRQAVLLRGLYGECRAVVYLGPSSLTWVCWQK